MQCGNHLAFAQHNKQGKGERTEYKNITCYKCGQLGHCRGSCIFKEYEQEKLKENGINLDSIVQGFNRVTAVISSIHVDHEADESNVETGYNSDSKNEYDDDSNPTTGACFRQVSQHTKN